MMTTKKTLLTALCLLALGSATAQTPAAFGSFASVAGAGSQGGEGWFQASRSYTNSRKNAWAMGSLASGSLHASASSAQVPCPNCGDYGNGLAGIQSRAAYWDTVSFNNGVNMGLADIALTISGQFSEQGGQAWVRWYVGSPKADFFQRISDYTQFQSLSAGTTVIEDDLLVPLGEATYFVYAELVVNATSTTYASAYADFGNSAHFSWTLPEGTTFGSASGTFLSATPVPEPGSLLLMLGGLTGLVWRRSRDAQH